MTVQLSVNHYSTRIKFRSLFCVFMVLSFVFL
uniref:Uncharacterized protein n=1 Tax=Anguilla anguilla TaxID=7936 RepID=A0A0E9TXM4_ANGAN